MICSRWNWFSDPMMRRWLVPAQPRREIVTPAQQMMAEAKKRPPIARTIVEQWERSLPQ